MQKQPVRPRKEHPTFTRSDRPARPAIVVSAGVGWGIVFAIGAALISGLAIFLNAFAVKQLPDAAVYTTLKNAVAAVILPSRRPTVVDVVGG